MSVDRMISDLVKSIGTEYSSVIQARDVTIESRDSTIASKVSAIAVLDDEISTHVSTIAIRDATILSQHSKIEVSCNAVRDDLVGRVFDLVGVYKELSTAKQANGDEIYPLASYCARNVMSGLILANRDDLNRIGADVQDVAIVNLCEKFGEIDFSNSIAVEVVADGFGPGLCSNL